MSLLITEVMRILNLRLMTASRFSKVQLELRTLVLL
jgi:hypothetical protein